jgi:hypothetical protein
VAVEVVAAGQAATVSVVAATSAVAPAVVPVTLNAAAS